MGAILPLLPSAISGSLCPLDLEPDAQCSTEHDSTSNRSDSTGLQILSPAAGSTLTETSSGLQVAWRLQLPLKIRRARRPYHERHWVHTYLQIESEDEPSCISISQPQIIHYQLLSVAKPRQVLWETWLDDEILVRRAAVNWEQVAEPERFLLPPVSSLLGQQASTGVELEIAVSLYIFDDDSLLYLGRENRTIKRSSLVLVTTDRTQVRLVS